MNDNPADKITALARQEGFDAPEPTLRVVSESAAGRPDLPWIKLPRQGNRVLDFAMEIVASPAVEGLYGTPWADAVMFVNPRRGQLEEMTADHLPTHIESRVITYIDRFVSRGGAVKEPTTMSEKEARLFLRCQQAIDKLPKIKTINRVRQPIIRSTGQLVLLDEGYDREAQVLTLPSEVRIDEEIKPDGAAEFLRSSLREFPFKDERSRAAQVLIMVAIYGRLLIGDEKRLAALYNGKRPRLGKGLLAQIAVAGPHGIIEVQPAAATDEEFRKALDVIALAQLAYAFIDEVLDRLANRSLKAFLTGLIWTGRLMFSQRRFVAPQTSLILCAGNNIDLDDDLAGRFVSIDLDAKEADPQARQIRDILTEPIIASIEYRSDLASALWALIRGWDEKHRPKGPPAFRGYEKFCEIFGGIIISAGFADPFASQACDRSPDFRDMQTLLMALRERIPGEAVEHRLEFRDIVDLCHEQGLFPRKLSGRLHKEFDGEDKATGTHFELDSRGLSRFGKFLADQAGLEYVLDNNRRVSLARDGSRGHRHFLVTVSPSTTPPSP
jgi:hypothetical protein